MCIIMPIQSDVGQEEMWWDMMRRYGRKGRGGRGKGWEEERRG